MNLILSLVLALIPLVTSIINLISVNKKVKLFLIKSDQKKKSTNVRPKR